MRRHGDRLSFVLDTQIRPEISRANEERGRGYAFQPEHGHPTSSLSSTCNLWNQADDQRNKVSVGTSDDTGAEQQQQQLLAPGWLEGW